MDDYMCRDDHGHLGYMVQCPDCKGWGRFDMGGWLKECTNCSGTGEVFVGEEDYYEPSRLTPLGADPAITPDDAGQEQDAGLLKPDC